MSAATSDADVRQEIAQQHGVAQQAVVGWAALVVDAEGQGRIDVQQQRLAGVDGFEDALQTGHFLFGWDRQSRALC
tara:strand:- start:410 stop:637 length:228 start_codon:yes stop_codon:yes gene_type:complete